MADLTVEEAHRLWSAGELEIVDVREEREHAVTRVEGMRLLPMSELIARMDEVPEDKPLAVFCRTGSRSARVADYLTAAGAHGEVANVEGGIVAWAAAGLPYEGDPPR